MRLNTHRENRVLVRGTVANRPRLVELESGDEICWLTIEQGASTHSVKANGRLSSAAAGLKRHQPVEIVGRLVSVPADDDTPPSAHVVALAIRERPAPRRGLRHRLRQVGLASAALILLGTWPGGFVLAVVLAPSIWGGWNGYLALEYPRLRPLRITSVAYRTAGVLVLLELIATVLR